MSMTNALAGAEVEQVAEYLRDKAKFVPVITKRRGFIVKVEYPGEEVYSNDTVLSVLVKFAPDQPPEKRLLGELNLIRPANERVQYALKKEIAQEKARLAMVESFEKPVVKDRVERR